MQSVALLISCAKPPVATTVTWSPISRFHTRHEALYLAYITVEHTGLHRGYGIPTMTCPGSLTSIRGNLAARWKKASAEIVTLE